jgi:uncharacterized membrane protein
VPAEAVPVTARCSGYVQAVDLGYLARTFADRGVTVRLRPRVGEHVVAGTVLAWAWGAARADSPPPGEVASVALERGVRIGFERTLEQDPGFGFRQLCDTSCKALSPAVNDPYTAIQAIEHLAVLYADLAARPVGDHVARDGLGTVVLVVPARRFAEHLALGVGLLRRYGAGEPTVIAALLRLLTACAALSLEDSRRWAAIEEQGRLLVDAAEASVRQAADLAPVHAEAETLQRVLAGRRAGRQVAAAAELGR